MVKKGSTIQVEIEGVAYKGKGISRVDGMVIFVPGTLPGDIVDVRITKKKKNYAEAIVIQRVKDSKQRITPFCSHAETCGGCTWQHADLAAQRKFKTEHVKEAIIHNSGLESDCVREIIGCEHTLGYRNKMEYSFGSRKWLTPQEIASGISFPRDGIYAGLHAPGRFDKILDLTECHLQPSPSFEILISVKRWMMQNKITAYDPLNHSGFMRNLVVRNSPKTSQWMINLITNGEDLQLFESLTHSLLEEFPLLTTILFTINDTRSPVAYGKREIVTHGEGKILEKLEDLSFWIRPQTFFQTNTLQAEKLFQVAHDAILSQRATSKRKSFGRCLDLYCGVGSITLSMHDLFERCIGVELVEESVIYARENAQLNGIMNCEFIAGDSSKVVSSDFLNTVAFPGGIQADDVLITDPPRAGMHPSVVQQILESGIKLMVYISCDPITLARDLGMLKEQYDVLFVQPVDMFPQTYHIENVTLLKRKS